MKKLSFLVILALCFSLIVGCTSTASTTSTAQTSATPVATVKMATATINTSKYASYLGDWSLKIDTDQDVYLLTDLETYFGSTGITIDEIKDNHVKGTVYSISGAPSNRIASVDFEGDIVNGKLTASYTDDSWDYSGKIELTFGTDKITANITRADSKTTPMWGIPKGAVTFIRPYKTQKVTLTTAENTKLKSLLATVASEMIKPFNEGALTDEMIINYVALNVGLGTITISTTDVKTGSDIVFSDTKLNEIAKKYLGVTVKTHKTTTNAKYSSGNYTVKAVGGVVEFPEIKRFMKDTENEGTYYAIVDYILGSPSSVKAEVKYQYLIKLQKTGSDYVIKSVKKISDTIDFTNITD